MYTREKKKEEEEEGEAQAIARKQEGREVRGEPSGRDLVGMQRSARINRSRDPGEFIRFAAASLKAARVSFASRSSRRRPGTHAGARIANLAHSHTQRTYRERSHETERKLYSECRRRQREREKERDGADVKVEGTNRDMPAYTSMLCSSGDRKEPDLARVALSFIESLDLPLLKGLVRREDAYATATDEWVTGDSVWMDRWIVRWMARRKLRASHPSIFKFRLSVRN